MNDAIYFVCPEGNTIGSITGKKYLEAKDVFERRNPGRTFLLRKALGKMNGFTKWSIEIVLVALKDAL